MSVKLVEVWRGALVESVHTGDIAVVDADGTILYSVGDPTRITYWRSAAKPVQAVPVVESGAAERFGLSDEEIAVITASHNGEDFHVWAVESVLRKIGLDASALQCGTHEPFHKPAARTLAQKGEEAGVLHCNCSGKHSGMLALAVSKGYDVSGYLDAEHPVQKDILAVVSEFVEMDPKDIVLGVDGCGVPVYGLPLSNMAMAYARMADASRWGSARQLAVDRITKTMGSFAHYVAGTGRICTELMKAAYPKVVSKSGAEGVYCLALPELGLGVALKISDGNSRASGPAALEVLAQLGVLNTEELANLHHYRPKITNNRGEVVGEIRPSFTLAKGVDRET